MDLSTGKMLNDFQSHLNVSYRCRACFGHAEASVLCGDENGQIWAWDLVDVRYSPCYYYDFWHLRTFLAGDTTAAESPSKGARQSYTVDWTPSNWCRWNDKCWCWRCGKSLETSVMSCFLVHNVHHSIPKFITTSTCIPAFLATLLINTWHYPNIIKNLTVSTHSRCYRFDCVAASVHPDSQ